MRPPHLCRKPRLLPGRREKLPHHLTEALGSGRAMGSPTSAKRPLQGPPWGGRSPEGGWGQKAGEEGCWLHRGTRGPARASLRSGATWEGQGAAPSPPPAAAGGAREARASRRQRPQHGVSVRDCRACSVAAPCSSRRAPRPVGSGPSAGPPCVLPSPALHPNTPTGLPTLPHDSSFLQISLQPPLSPS